MTEQPTSHILKRVAETTSVRLARDLLERFGGQELDIPTTVKPEHPLTRALGAAGARLLVEHFAGCRLSVPRFWRHPLYGNARLIAELDDGGRSANEVAGAAGVAARTVRRHRSRTRGGGEGDQPDLFD